MSMDPMVLGGVGVVTVLGLLVGAAVLWWTIKATISMAKRMVALAFVLLLTTALLAGAAAAFFATQH
jgi:hypothetical protein